jgi:GntR family transcriptional regulator/MocR family aminotransferase
MKRGSFCLIIFMVVISLALFVSASNYTNYTTPSNQYPTGIKMSLERRIEVLKWASEKSALVIEDDYNHEFSNWENPISAIHSLDNQNRVIYLGTFNKLLHPSIRLGYMIVPKYLIDTVTSLYEQSSRFVAPSQQQVLSNFIEKDFLNKHLRRILEVSKERKKVFIKTFNLLFEKDIFLNISNNPGMHLTGFLDNSIEDKRLARYLKSKDIIAHPLSNYYIDQKPQNGLVMGYCSVNSKTIKETIVKMREVFDNYMSLQ